MRAAGAVLLLLFFYFLGVYAGEREKKRMKECAAFLEFFEYVKNQIRYFLTPTKTIYGNYANEILEVCGFLPELRSHENDEVYHDVWRSAFVKCEKKFHLSAKQRELVLGFGESVGKSNGQMQTEGFEYYICEMREQTEKQKSESVKNAKLYRTLGLAAGACAAILVI